MPYYSELGIYTPSSSYTSPLFKGPYSNHSSIIASNILPVPKQIHRSNFRGFKPHLTTISEANITAPLRRISSPTVIYHSSPKVRVQRPIKINTADIDVSVNKYRNYPERGSAEKKSPSPRKEVPVKQEDNIKKLEKEEKAKKEEKEAKPNTNIRRDRATIRLQTFHKDTLEKEIGTIKSWRDKFKPEDLVTEAKVKRKSPGEILKDKFLIRNKSKENVSKLDSPKLTRRPSIKKTASFKDICNVITSDNAVQDLNPGQPINIRRKQSRDVPHDDILREIKRSSSVLSVEEVELLDALIQAENEVGLYDSPPVIEEKRKSVRKKRAARKKSSSDLNQKTEKEEDAANRVNLIKSSSEISIPDSAPISKLRKDSSLQNMIKDISQVEIEMIPVKQKPIITGSIGDIEEKAKNNLKVVVEDYQIQESPKPKKEKKFRFNVTIQEFPVKKNILVPKHELSSDDFGTVQLPGATVPVITSILKKKEHTHSGNDLGDGKVFKKKTKLLKSLSEVQVSNKAANMLQKSGSNDSMHSNFTVLVNKSKSDEGVSGNTRTSSGKLKILSIESTQSNTSNRNIPNSDETETLLKTAKQELKENTFLSKSDLGQKKTVPVWAQRLKTDKIKNVDEEKSFERIQPETTRSVEDVDDEKTVNITTKKDDTIKTERDKNELVSEEANKDSVKNTAKIKREVKIEDNKTEDAVNQVKTSSLQDITKLKEEKIIIEDKNELVDEEVKKCVIEDSVKEVKTHSLKNTAKTKQDLVKIEDKKELVHEETKKSIIEDSLKTEQSDDNSKKIENDTKNKENKEDNSPEADFWANDQSDKYEPPKLKLEPKDPKEIIEEMQADRAETPEELQMRIMSKRSLIEKANKSDPDLKVFEPPTPPPPEPAKEPTPEPSFVPLQSNRLSQWMHPWKKPEQKDDCSVEIYAKPKFIRARHIPRRWQQNAPSESEDSTTSEDSSSDDSEEEDDDEVEEEEEETSAENKIGTSSTDSRDSPGGLHPALNQAFALDFNDLPEEVCQSSTYQSFQKSGRITPPATTIPRFRKYCVDDFNFLKVLGKGSFGKVLLAELKGTEYYYAVKCLKKDVVLEDDDVECTLIERKVLALGTKHPYLCHLLCTFQTESHLFFVMEYLNGGDLMFHIQVERRFSEARARFYGAEIVSGLKFLHNKGIVYRDLKLDNILLDFDGHVRIADFGMCKLQIFLDRMADTFCGTPDYMAPEIIKGQHYNQCVDWWSFGVLLYEMLLGQSPFSGCDEDELFWSICNEKPVIPRFLSAEASSVLTQFLEKDANKRLGNRFSPHGDIQDHPFFQPIDWPALEARKLEPPFKPNLQHPLDTQYFDKTFTTERAKLTPIEAPILQSMDQTQFQGFSYTNPNATDK